MTRNQNATKSGLEMGWHWYRQKPDNEPFPAKVFTVGGIEHAWLCGPTSREQKRVDHCTGEFVRPLELTKTGYYWWWGVGGAEPEIVQCSVNTMIIIIHLSGKQYELGEFFERFGARRFAGPLEAPR